MSELTTVGAAFVCTVCGEEVRSRFLPDITPKCPSCGADTRPAQGTLRAEVHAFCSHCHYEGPAYVSSLCPKCGSHFNGLPGTRPESARVAPGSHPRVHKQGPSGGIKSRPRKMV